MAVAVFGASGTVSNAGGDPFDATHTVDSGQSDVCLVGGVGWRSGNTHTLATWDPVGVNEALTEDAETAGTSNRRAAINHLAAPTAGTSKILRFDFSGIARGGGGGINFSGVDQTTPISNATSETAASGDLNVTVTTNADADDLVVDAVAKNCSSSGTLTAGAGQTDRWNVDSAGENMREAGSTEGAGTNPTEMDWTFTGVDNAWSSCGMLMNAAAAGGGGLSIPVAMANYRRLRENL